MRLDKGYNIVGYLLGTLTTYINLVERGGFAPPTARRVSGRQRLRLVLSIEVLQAGLEPARARRLTNFQGWPVCHFRHCSIVGSDNGAGRLLARSTSAVIIRWITQIIPLCRLTLWLCSVANEAKDVHPIPAKLVHSQSLYHIGSREDNAASMGQFQGCFSDKLTPLLGHQAIINSVSNTARLALTEHKA